MISMIPRFRPIQNESTEVGVPSNCNELNTLGHTVNGIYLVKSESSNKKNTAIKLNSRIEAVYCDFNSPKTNSSKKMIQK